MPYLKRRHRYTKVYRPTGTRYADGEDARTLTRRASSPTREVISISAVQEAVSEAVRRALVDYMVEYHPLTGIPADVLDQCLIIEAIATPGKVRATVLVIPEEEDP